MKPMIFSYMWAREKAQNQNIPLIFRIFLLPFLIGGYV